MAIQQLPSTSTLSGSDSLALFSAALGADAKATLATLLAWLQPQVASAIGTQTQYFAPNATGWSVTVAPPSAGINTWLLITPTGAFAAGTIVLPPVATLVDGQEVLISCTQAVTTLSVTGNGATAVNGAATTLAANGFFRMKFDMPSKSWFRA